MGSTPGAWTEASSSKKKMNSKFRPVTGQDSSFVMACSYARYNITVNAIGPALFETEMTANTLFKSEAFLQGYNMMNPADRPGHKGELNGTVLYLSSDASSYVQGQFIIVDGGGSLV